MAHEIETMFYVKQKPWHGLGIELQDPPTSEDAIIQAGLDWEVKLNPISVNGVTYKDFIGITRSTDNKLYGVVREKYTPLQNKDAFKFFDPFITEKLAQYETAGSLKEGARVWILAKINDENLEITKGDEIQKYLLLSNGHDGKHGIRVQFTPIRVVCNNTLTMAEKSNAIAMRLAHLPKVVSSLEELHKTINLANRSFNSTLEDYKKMLDTPMKDIEQYVQKVFYPKNTDDQAKNRVIGKVINLFKDDPTNNIANISGSVWSAYNAVTQFIDHDRGSDQSSRLYQAWFGYGNHLKNKAHHEAILLAA